MMMKIKKEEHKIHEIAMKDVFFGKINKDDFKLT
jgi:hypothetical protein